MDGAEKTKTQLQTELAELRRRLAELEAAAVDHRLAEQRLAKDARASEAALRLSEARGHALLESASEGIVLIDATGRIVLVNAAAERLFGYPRAELLGQRLEILLPESARDRHLEHRAGYFEEPRVRRMGIGLDLAGRRRNGAEFPVEISLSYVPSPEGMLAMAFITDITERKRIETELQRQRDSLYQTEKLAALGTLAAGVAHEMNNPLGIITSRIEVMLLEANEQNLPPQVIEDLQVLHRASQRVARIAASLRSFARQSPREQAPVDLNAVVEEAVLLMQKPLTVDGIEIATKLDRTLTPILGDASALQQVFMNLLTNAREAMTTGGAIRIETMPVPEAPGGCRVVITDTGPGIAEESLSKIFDPFYSTKPTGTGLGLSVSYGIIQSHKGTMEVRSKPGQGTTFILTFPVPAVPD